MKPSWDQLMDEFKDSKTALIADVDCTVHQDLCGTHGVEGYPTIKYGDPNNMEDYQGGRDLEDLQTFAKENLGPSCGPNNLDLCDEEAKKTISDAQALSDADLDAKIKKYEELSKEKDATIAAVMKSGLGTLKSVKAAKATGKKEL